MTHPDDGAASILVISCCALLLVIAGVVAARETAVMARHRAESAADLAALAGAQRIGLGADECAKATVIARANGASLDSCSVALASNGRSGSVSVRVSSPVRLPFVGGSMVSAQARAARLSP